MPLANISPACQRHNQQNRENDRPWRSFHVILLSRSTQGGRAANQCELTLGCTKPLPLVAELDSRTTTCGNQATSAYRALAAPGIAAGAILAFARALGEFGATVVLAGNLEGETRTIALAVYTLLEAPAGRSAIWLLVGASLLLSGGALLGYEVLSRRQRGRMEVRR